VVPGDIVFGRPGLAPPTPDSGIPRVADGLLRMELLAIGVPALFMAPAAGEFPMAVAVDALLVVAVDGVDAGKNLTCQAG